MEAAFRRYRIMSYVTGTTLLILCAIWVLSQILSKHDMHAYGFALVGAVVGIGHGFILYPIYMFTCFDFVLKARTSLLLLVGMFLSGFVPGLAFYMEHRIGVRYHMIPTKEAP